METDRNWIVVHIDGKLAGISMDYGRLADIAVRIAQGCGTSEVNKESTGKGQVRKKAGHLKDILPYGEVTARTVTFEEILNLRLTTRWEDLMLFGTDFQKRIWKKLWDLSEDQRLLSYSDFAGLCDNRAGVRAVAHAIGLNPIPVLIPCHLIVPKEAIDRIGEIQKKAQNTIFKGDDLCLESILRDPAIDFGEYALGKEVKRMLIYLDMNK